MPENEHFSSYSAEQLLHALASDNRDALRELFDRYWEKLFAVARTRVRTPEIAEERVQDLFLEIWQQRHRLREVRSVEAYLFTVLKHLVIDYIRSREGHWDYAYYESTYPTRWIQATDEQLAHDELLALLDAELGQMPEKTSVIFRLSRFEERTIPEISQQLNVSVKTVEYHLSKALRILRKKLPYAHILLL